jgi:hypothetical protein
MTVAAFACLAVTLPFYLYDPKGFTPLHVYYKLAQFESAFPCAGVVIPLAGGILAAALAFQRMDERCVVLFRNCAIVLAWPVVWAVGLWSVSLGCLELQRFAWYGIGSLVFGALACWVSLFGTPAAAASGRGKERMPALP